MAQKDQADTIAFRPKPKDVQNMLGSIKAKFLDRYPRVERANQVAEMSKEESTYFVAMPGYKLFNTNIPIKGRTYRPYTAVKLAVPSKLLPSPLFRMNEYSAAVPVLGIPPACCTSSTASAYNVKL